MKPGFLIIVSSLAWLFFCFSSEAIAVRPPLKPMDIDHLRHMVSDAEVIVTGTVTAVTRSRTLEGSQEIVLIRAVIAADKVLKGDMVEKTITIEESYRQFRSEDTHEKGITATHAGPSPPVGVYREGDRILVFLQAIDRNNLYRPLGSGDHDAYLGIFHILSGGIVSDRFAFDDSVSKYSRDDDSLLTLIASMTGE